MDNIGSETVLHTFILFCRVGGCLMFMPGFASPRVPMQVRIFLALAATLALAPIMLPDIKAAMAQTSHASGLMVLLSETTKGALIGIMGRLFFLALEFAATLGANAAGITAMAGLPIEGAEPVPAFAALIMTAATALFFITDQHWEVLRALLASYRAMPVSADFSTQLGLVQLTDTCSKAFVLALQICSPFIIYSIAINVLFGIANKLTPQIAVYFVSLPFVIMGGLIILYFIVGDFLRLFIMGFAGWLTTG